MPHAICDNGHLWFWRNQRGNRKPETCRDCGLPLFAAKFDYKADRYVKYVPSVQPKRHSELCAICGKRRMVPSWRSKRVEADTEYWMPHPNQTRKQVIKAGSIVCWSHVPATEREPETPVAIMLAQALQANNRGQDV